MKSHSERGMPGRRRTEREGRGGCAAGGGGGARTAGSSGVRSWMSARGHGTAGGACRAWHSWVCPWGAWHSWRDVQGMARHSWRCPWGHGTAGGTCRSTAEMAGGYGHPITQWHWGVPETMTPVPAQYGTHMPIPCVPVARPGSAQVGQAGTCPVVSSTSLALPSPGTFCCVLGKVGQTWPNLTRNSRKPIPHHSTMQSPGVCQVLCTHCLLLQLWDPGAKP